MGNKKVSNFQNARELIFLHIFKKLKRIIGTN